MASANRLIGQVVKGDAALLTATDDLVASEAAGADSMHTALLQLMHDHRPPDLASRSGFQVRGSSVARAAANRAETEVLGGALVRVFAASNPPAVEVLLELSDGRCVLAPAVRDHMATLSFHDGQLVDIAYEPMVTSRRWAEFHHRSQHIRDVHAAVAAATRLGVLDLTGEHGTELIGLAHSVSGVDPTLAVYVAYACHDVGRSDLTKSLGDAVRDAIGVSIFDLDLLARRLPSPGLEGVSSLPLLSRGWALNVTGVPDSTFQELHALRRLPSLWTIFSAGQWDRIRRSTGREHPAR